MPNHDRLAFDRGSVRSIDQDGRLRVEWANISKANVCPYLGSEIPDAEALGLDPKQIYKLLRDPDELAKAAPSFNNIPLLSEHVPVSADDHRPGLVVGATGSDAEFVAPYLRNSLVVWAADAIKGIENDEQRELSCAYRYVADMTPGTYRGESYSGVMRQIRGNHVALVQKGRAGSDVVVGDSQPKEIDMKKQALSRKATLAKGALMVFLKPRMAADAKLNLDPVLAGVTNATWAKAKASLIDAIKPKLAKDASIEDVIALLDSLDGEQPSDLGADEPAAELDANLDNGGNSKEDMPDAVDADPVAEILAMLKGKLSDEDHAAVGEKIRGLVKPAEDDFPEDLKKGKEDKKDDEPKAADEPPPFEGKPKAADKDDDKDEKVNKAAMDAAIKLAVDAASKAAEEKTIARMRGVQAAEEAVKPFVGKLTLAADSAEGVYKAALEVMGVKTEGIHASAYKAILEAQPKPGAAKPRIASDSARPQGFADRFPSAAALRKV